MNSIIDEVLTKDSKNVNKLPDLDRSTDKANNTVDICESIKSRESIFAIATEESKNVCPQEEEEENINTPTTKVDETIFKTDEFEETAAKKLKTVIDNDKNINPTINKECSESKYNKRDDDIVKKEPEEQTVMLSNINFDREFVIINKENHKRETGDKKRQSYDVSEPASEEETEDFKKEVEDIEITGDQEMYEIRLRKANGTKAKDLTDDENKEHFISDKILFEGVKDEINCKIEGAMYEKETYKNCDVDEKYEDSRGNKSFLNNDVLDLYDSPSKYSEEDETEFITLKEDELNTIHDLYKSTDKSTSIHSNVFETLKSTERIVAAATKELKGVYSQGKDQINAAMTKIYESNVNIQENKGKAPNNSKTIVDNDKNIKVEDIEIPADEELDEIILPDENDDGEDSVYNYQTPQSNYLSTVQLQTKTTNTTVYSTSSSPSSSSPPYLNSNSTSCALIRKRQHKVDENECIPDKSKEQKQQVKSDESSFIQSIATRSQRLTTSVKKYKRSTKVGVNAPTKRIRLNDTTPATVTSIEEYTENNDGEDLLQATWIENDETPISDDDEAKKQHQQQTQQQDHYSSSSSVSSSFIFSERLHKRNKEAVIIGDEDNYENNDKALLVSALRFPKNVDPQMFINEKNKNRCVICNEDFKCLVYHYVNEHRGCEIYNSRLSPSQIKFVKEGRCEVSKLSVFKSHKYYEACCIFCQKSRHLTSHNWYQHFTRHTGEFAYRCTGCGLRKPIRPAFTKHKAQGCPKARVVQDYFVSSKGCAIPIPIEANVCNLCKYVQLHRSNIEKHLHTQHNIEQISAEHIQTIALLTIPTSMTATYTDSKIGSRRWNKRDAGASLPSSSHASNTYGNDDNDDDNDVTFDKILPGETSPETDPPTIINRFEEFTKCHEAIGDLNKSSGSRSLLLPSRAEKKQEEIIIGDDDDNENNDKPSLVSALGFPKNVDPQMFINDKNKNRCVICNEDFNSLVYHYVNEHRGCEIYNSRLSPSQIKLVKQGRCDITNGSLYKCFKHFEAFCIFCQENQCLRPLNWHQHFTRHTGEFAYRCTGCGLRKPICDFREHKAQGCPKAGVAKDYVRHSRGRLSIEANVCNLCNYVQLYRGNIEKHLHVQHNIEQILPEHIQTIVILSTRTSMTAPSTGSKIESKRWNKSDAAPSVPSSSHASNTYVNDDNDDDNDVTFDKILPEETPPQTHHPTIKNKFEEFTNCHKATEDFNDINGSPSLLLPSHAEKNQEGIITGDDDDNENNDKHSLDSVLRFPKNVDPQMVINEENKERCVICNKDFNNIVHHYVNEHRGCEIYNSRLSPSQIKFVKEGRYEVSKVSVFKSHKYYEASCIFCQQSLHLTLHNWYQHFPRHTGEFAYRCTGCGLRKPMRHHVRRHQAQECPKARVAQDYFRSSKGRLPIEANVCNLCNYVQLHRSNIERHLHVQHNIKQILPEHIQTIALLSITTSVTAPSTGSKTDSNLWNKHDAATSLLSSSYASNTYVIDDNDATSFGKIVLEENQPQTNPSTINNSVKELTNSHKATGNLKNSGGSPPSVLLPSHTEKNQEGIIIGDDGENDNPSLVSTLGWPKNDDPQMFMNDENKDRCFICKQDFMRRLVYHYVNEHRGCEIYNSRLSPSQIKIIKVGRCEVSNVSLHKKYKHYEAFCIFCQENLRFTASDWYDHFTRHTGEFAYRCTGCGLRKPRRPDFGKHQAQVCPKAKVVQDYFRSSRGCPIPVKANVCNLCNYVQLYRSNIERHLHMQHNIKNILPEHMQPIVLLSIPTSMTAISKISLPSSSHTDEDACNSYLIANDDKDSDNNVTFEKMVKQETSLQANSPTINKTFDESTNCHTVICSKVITLADVSAADA